MTMDPVQRVTDAEFAALFAGIRLDPPCNWPKHELGGAVGNVAAGRGYLGGCHPDEPGAWVIRTRPVDERHAFIPPVVLIVCRTRMAWLRIHANTSMGCGHCDARFTIGDQFEFVGPLSEYRP